jgi:polyisoprenoid-binding protein YceI
MRKLATALLALTVSFVSIANDGGNNYKLDTEKSIIKWIGKKVGGQHSGGLTFKSGSLEMKDNNITKASFTTDMNSITCSDMDGKYGEKLIGHLKSNDFFDVENHATANFEMSSFTSNNDGTGTMVGKLTIKGISQEISVPVSFKSGNGMVALRGDVKFDRTKFGIEYGSASLAGVLKDKAINDEVEFSFTIIAKTK